MIKDWIIILGSLLILAIIIDGIRRKRNDRYGKIRMSPAMRKRAKLMEEQEPEKEVPPTYISELPNGGARVIGQRDSSEIVQGLLKSTRSNLPKHQQKKDEVPVQKPARPPQQTQLNLDEAVPMLMESVNDSGLDKPISSQRIEPHFSEDNDDREQYESDDYEDEDFDKDDQSYENEEGDGDYPEDSDDDYDEVFDEEDEPAEDDNIQADTNTREAEEVFVLHVMATNDRIFRGNELLDTVLQCGMRFGEMNIFHRYVNAKGQGAPLFSMANILKPGTFDLDAMDEFTTPGVSFFMTLPIEADSLQTFELMVDTARAVAGTLGGEIRDDQRSIMTKQTLEHSRECIRDYERQRLFRRPR